MLKARFYSPPQVGDLTEQTLQRDRFEVSSEITKEEITAILQTCSFKSAAGEDEVPFTVLKQLGDPVISSLTTLINASWRLHHFPQFFWKARTIVLKKPGKGSYEEVSMWQPIALLKTIGKVVEKATARRIRDAAEEHSLLPSEQMGARAD